MRAGETVAWQLALMEEFLRPTSERRFTGAPLMSRRFRRSCPWSSTSKPAVSTAPPTPCWKSPP
jgi:hypothetical protein